MGSNFSHFLGKLGQGGNHSRETLSPEGCLKVNGAGVWLMTTGSWGWGVSPHL